MENFDLKKFLVENNLTANSKVLNKEQQYKVGDVVKLLDRPVQGANYFFEYEDTVQKIGKTHTLVGTPDVAVRIPNNRIYPYVGFEKRGQKFGKDVWVKI
jgi:hypothetical protein